MAVVLVPVLAVIFATSARAEADYEFAKLLISSEQSFNTDDLVEHLIAQLDQNPATKSEGRLIKATLRRKQAGPASPEKGTALLDEAQSLYQEVIKDKKFRLLATAEKEYATIDSDKIRRQKLLAEEVRKTDPERAKKILAQAAATWGTMADAQKEATDKAWVVFEPVFKRYLDFKKVPGNSDADGNLKPIPPDILQPLMKGFDPWLSSEKRYVALRIEQIECYDETDPTKKTLGDELAKFCEKRTTEENGPIGEFPVIVAWYTFMRGRTYAALQSFPPPKPADPKEKPRSYEELATETWKEVGGDSDLADDQKKQFMALKRLVIQSLIRMKMQAKKYGDVELIISEILLDSSWQKFWEEDGGKNMIIIFAKACTLPSDSGADQYEKAIKKLREFIAKETKGGVTTRWGNEFSRTIAELLEESRTKATPIRPKLSASEWYDAARGFFLLGQNEYKEFTEKEKEFKEATDAADKTKKKEISDAKFDKAYGEYQNAVDYYRRSITEARLDKSLLVRVTVEPKAWFEIGLCYVKMKHYYEATIANLALRDTYLPNDRKRWMPDLKKAEHFKYAKLVQEVLADLDKPQSGLIAKANQNLIYALDENEKAHKNREDGWNRKFKNRILSKEESMPDSGIVDPDYVAAKNDMDDAKNLSDQAKTQTGKQAEEGYIGALAKYTAAAGRFLKVKPGTKAYEIALYQSGTSYMMAQAIWATGRIPSRAAEGAAQNKELAKNALDSFKKYEEYLAANKAEKPEDEARRKKTAGAVLLARNSLNSGAQNWEEVIRTADEYVAWEDTQENMTNRAADVALMNKFRALVELAARIPESLPPKCDPYLEKAENAMRQWRKMKEKDNKTYVLMLNALSHRNNRAALQGMALIRRAKENNEPTTVTAQNIENYELAVVKLWSERVQIIEDAQDQEPSLEDYARLLYLLNKNRKEKEVCDLGLKVLQKFDPDSKNIKLPEDEKFWQAHLEKMNVVIRYNDLKKNDQCKLDHRILIDYMYDTREGAVLPDGNETRPKNDKFNSDMERALKQIETIRKNYPDCQTLDPKLGEGGKPLLARAKEDMPIMGMVEEEVEYRRKIKATRELVFSQALQVAMKVGNDFPDEAKRYRGIAANQLEAIEKLTGPNADLQNKKAEIYISIGEYEKALETLKAVLIDEKDQGSVVYFDASKRISQVYKLQKKWTEAVDYPAFIALTAGIESDIVKARWADMKEFLKECYANGAKLPTKLIQDLNLGDAKAAEPKPDEKKEGDAPKPDAPKADAPAPDAKKPDEKKPDEKQPDEKK